jgi:folylpolyglutamate synthase
MGFYVFLKERVDVAIVEVGIGGALDYTNIVRKPVVCGISSLGFDHTAILGDTIEEIAWQKAGILKIGAPAFTVKQDAGGLPVIEQRARDLKIPLYIVPDLSQYPGQFPELSLAGNYQHTNASLALQLCHSWMITKDKGNNLVL